MTGQQALLYLSLKYNGNWDLIYQAIREKKFIERDEFDRLSKLQVGPYITVLDLDYPKRFLNAVKPPFVIYYRGNLELLKDEGRCLSYVGSRNATPYGERMAKEICAGLAKKGVVICNGMARGIDSIALRSALEAGGKGIAVLGSGIENPYPNSSRDVYERLLQEGLVISEYPLSAEPKRDQFPLRNRIVAAIGKALVVGEASRLSGSLITVNFALGYGKDVGCIPFEAGLESGCNSLIKDGAHLIETAEDAYGLLTPP